MTITTHKTASGNGLALPYSFTGKEKDAETGFSYFGARYYDSDLSGPFLSVDPMADKYPSISPYAYCAWNPIRLVDPDGMEFDPTTEDKYIRPYEKEINERINKINGLKNTSKWKSEYQSQIDEYKTILGEIKNLRDDANNVYSIKTGFDFNDNTTTGELRYAGNKEGKKQINILIASKHKSIFMFMGDVAHELKHAHLYYMGDLAFYCDENMNQISSSDTKELERAANSRGDMFINCITNGRPMKYDYNLDVKNYQLSPIYNDFPDNKSQVVAIGKYVIKNTPQ